MEADQLVQEIAKLYKDTESIKRTANALNLSPQKVRKALITMGLYTSPSISQANRLYQAGLSVEDIAIQMDITPGAVAAMLPYRRTPYNFDLTPNAQKIKAWRTRRTETADTSQEPPE